MKLIRSGQRITPDERRVIAKFFTPDVAEREKRIVETLLALPEKDTEQQISCVLDAFSSRHRDVERIFKDNYNRVSRYIKQKISLDRKLLIGAYFTMEYSVESTALFNPSIVPHPDQLGLEPGELRVIVSFRAVGEGHISSIVFRRGVIDKNGDITLEENSPLIEMATLRTSTLYDKKEFAAALEEVGLTHSAKPIMEELISHFSQRELDEAIEKYDNTVHDKKKNTVIDTLNLLALTNYTLAFNQRTELSGRVVFPVSKSEKKGLEDARFVAFEEDPGRRIYYATYTAFNGNAIIPQLIETRDFLNFTVSPLLGSGAKNKGLAIFPEKINGKYAIISRQDNENIFIMFSDNIKKWEEPILICQPRENWELVQLGNCGPPIKTEKGWLLLTHGVGPVRTYAIGALLLDLQDPTRVIGRLRRPLLAPDESERNGYVPNVVYSCGSIINGDWLVIPYAISDSVSSFAKIKLTALLDELVEKKKTGRPTPQEHKNTERPRTVPG